MKLFSTSCLDVVHCEGLATAFHTVMEAKPLLYTQEVVVKISFLFIDCQGYSLILVQSCGEWNCISSIYHIILLWIVWSNTDDNGGESWYTHCSPQSRHIPAHLPIWNLFMPFVLLKCIKMFHFIFSALSKKQTTLFSNHICATLEKHIHSIKDTVIIKCDLCALLFPLGVIW